MIAGEVIEILFGIFPSSYILGWAQAIYSGVEVHEMLDSFTLPPLFWHIVMLLLGIIFIPRVFIIRPVRCIIRWYKKPSEEFQKQVKEAIKAVEEAIELPPDNYQDFEYEYEKYKKITNAYGCTDTLIKELETRGFNPPDKINPYDKQVDLSLMHWQECLRDVLIKKVR